MRACGSFNCRRSTFTRGRELGADSRRSRRARSAVPSTSTNTSRTARAIPGALHVRRASRALSQVAPRRLRHPPRQPDIVARPPQDPELGTAGRRHDPPSDHHGSPDRHRRRAELRAQAVDRALVRVPAHAESRRPQVEGDHRLLRKHAARCGGAVWPRRRPDGARAPRRRHRPLPSLGPRARFQSHHRHRERGCAPSRASSI